jgi:hypothetical protein
MAASNKTDSPQDLAESFRELQRLREQVRELEKAKGLQRHKKERRNEGCE